MKRTLLLSFSILLLSCGSTKRISFKSDTFMSSGIKEKFEMIIPRGYSVESSDLKTNLLKKWTYPDESFIYISLDISFSDSPNISNWVNCSDVSKKFKCTDGVDKQGNYWKEVVKNNLVIGYKNVSVNNKSEFDNTILSFQKID